MRDLPVKLRPLFLVAALVTTLFVIYGSFVPFVLRPHSFAEAVALFSDIRYLQLGAASRADLLANAIIYMPVSLFWMAVIAPEGRLKLRHAQVIIAIAALVALSVLVEFLQVYVAPRTVSKNDIIAESVGILAGAIIWGGWGSWLSQGLQRLLLKGRISCDSLLLLLSVAVVGYSLLPFDFFISVGEIRQAIEQRGLPLFGMLADSGTLRLSARVLLVGALEFIIALGLGFIAYRTDLIKRFVRGQIVLLAFLIFTTIELAQFFEYSGNSTLTSALVKTLGVYVGLRLGTVITYDRFLHLVGVYKARFLLFWPLYVSFALFIKGWSLIPEFDVSAIEHIMSEVSFIPFYYHYFTTEMAAFKSALLQVALVSPLVLHWWSVDKMAIVEHCLLTPQQWKRLPRRMWIGAALALCVEVGGLLWSSLRPDFTNILIIVLSIPFIYGVFELLYRSIYRISSRAFKLTEQASVQAKPASTAVNSHHMNYKAVTTAGWRAYIPRVRCSNSCAAFAFMVWGGAAWYWLQYPLARVLLGFIALCYIGVLQRYPLAALVVIPAGIPLLDLYPLSGRFFMTELDFMILLTLGSQYLAGHIDISTIRRNRPLWLMLAITSVVYLISITHALWGHMWWDLRSVTSFYSPMNVLRLSKAWLWFVLLLPVLSFYFKQYPHSFLRFSQGILLGLMGVLFAVVVERYLFTGLFDFESVMHRVRGSFVTMHTGGGHIDAFLVTTIPFLLYPFITQARLWVRLVALITLLVSLYVVFVTYSRGPYIVAGGVGLVMLASFVLAVYKQVSTKWVAGISLLVLSVAISWAAIPFVFNSFLTQRLSIVTQDKETRVNQWARVANYVDGSAMTYLFGHGPGLLPRSIMLDHLNTDQPSAMHELVSDEGNVFLSLSAGRSLYTNQYVSVEQDKRYEYSFRYRSPESIARLRFSLCEKWIDDSFRCQVTAFELAASDDWTTVNYPILIDAFPPVAFRDTATSHRPITIGISVVGATMMALDNIDLSNMSGRSLLRNGDFSSGKDYWFVTSDDHLDWHAKNVIVNIYHDQGVLGVLSFLGLVTLALSCLLKQLVNHNRKAVILLGALTGYLGVGMVASVFEVPQLALLLYFVVGVIFLLPSSSSSFSRPEHHKTA